MTSRLAMLSSLGVGALSMYLFDPERGRRRRTSLRDQIFHAMRKSGNFLRVGARDLSHRAQGLVAEAHHIMRYERPSNEVLFSRVRSAIGRASSHPHAIHVEVTHGRVTLSGPVLRNEVNKILSRVSKVNGVKEVNNQLEIHSEADRLSSLQGGKPRGFDRFELMQSNWSPGARILVIAGSAGTLFYGLRRHDARGALLSAMSFGFLARAVTNIEAKRLLGIAGGRKAVTVHKTININAPIEHVFGFWANLENFQKFMPDIKAIDRTGSGRLHWVIKGPAGLPVSWDAVVSQVDQNKLIAWRSEPGAVVQNAGRVQFSPNPKGGTTVDVDISYNPPAGLLGHAVALLFGADPKSKMDEDLMRMKTLLEVGPSERQTRRVV